MMELDHRVRELETRLREGSHLISQQSETIRGQNVQLAQARRKIDNIETWHQEGSDVVSNVLSGVADQRELRSSFNDLSSSNAETYSSPIESQSRHGADLDEESQKYSPVVYEQLGEERGVEGIIATLCLHSGHPHSQEAGFKVLQHLANNGARHNCLSVLYKLDFFYVFVYIFANHC